MSVSIEPTHVDARDAKVLLAIRSTTTLDKLATDSLEPVEGKVRYRWQGSKRMFIVADIRAYMAALPSERTDTAA